jgi:hypothetical protein
MTPVSDFQGRPFVKPDRKTRARPKGRPAGRQHPISTTEASHEFLSELEGIYSTKSAEIEPLSAPMAYRANSSQFVQERPRDSKTESHDFVNRSPYQILALSCYDFISRIVGWILTLLGTVLTLLQFPIAVLITLLIMYWGPQMAFVSLPFAKVNLCEYPLVSRLEFCQMSSSGTAHLPPQSQRGPGLYFQT